MESKYCDPKISLSEMIKIFLKPFFIDDEFFIVPVIRKIKNKSEYERLLSNFVSLSVLQGANYLLPLITLPYLVRVLGADKFGLISFAQAFVQYFVIITDYGFNLSATREISINRDNLEKISEIFSSVMIIKTGLLVITMAIMGSCVLFWGRFAQDWPVYWLTFGMVLGQVMFPAWFFQGMERMKYITFLNVLAKTIFTVAVFVFVKEQSDYLFVPALTSLGFIISGIASLVVIRRMFGIGFSLQRLTTLKYHLSRGWHIFASQLSISLFSNTNTVILGLFANNTMVGYYAAAEKVMRALAMLQVPVTGAIYPYMAQKIKTNSVAAMSELRKIIKFGSILYGVLLTFVFICADWIIRLLYSSSMDASVNLLRIIAFVPLTIFLNNIFGTQIMLNTNREKQFFKVLFSGGVINVCLASILSSFYMDVGAAVALLLVEVYVMVGMFLYVHKDLRHAGAGQLGQDNL